MTAHATSTATQADLDAALPLLAQLGIDPADLARVAPDKPLAPTFAEVGHGRAMARSGDRREELYRYCQQL